jgi:hypothetical protein
MAAPDVRQYLDCDAPEHEVRTYISRLKRLEPTVTFDQVKAEFEAQLYADDDDEIIAEVAVQLRRRGWVDEDDA